MSTYILINIFHWNAINVQATSCSSWLNLEKLATHNTCVCYTLFVNHTVSDTCKAMKYYPIILNLIGIQNLHIYLICREFRNNLTIFCKNYFCGTLIFI